MRPLKFSVDARAILTLGRDSIKDNTTAVVELVKNSYDADATLVEVELHTKPATAAYIRIADNGDGMTEADITSRWLRIGYSDKRANTVTAQYSRRKTGEKGIGRLSADRLGAELFLASKAIRKAPIGMHIDWSKFDHPGMELGEIELSRLRGPTLKLPDDSKTGTELKIGKLRQRWTPEDVAKLYHELELLHPPFVEIASNFKILFSNDVRPELNGVIEASSAAIPDVAVEADVAPNGTIRYKLTYRTGRKRTRVQGQVPWSRYADSNEADDAFKLGAFKIQLGFYPRTSDLLENSGISLRELRNFLDRHAGIKIYRDLIRVKPYGDLSVPDGDWLGLGDRRNRNPAGAGRESFRASPSQLVGGIFISRDQNSELADSSSREGLIEGDAFGQLRLVIMQCVILIENRYHRMHVAERGDAAGKAAQAKVAVRSLQTELSTLKTELTELSMESAPSQDANIVALDQINVVLAKLEKAEHDIEEIASQNTVFRGLATVGIASAVFGHETEMSTDMLQGELSVAKISLEDIPPAIPDAINAINNANQLLQPIASWGKFALLRVKKDKRKRKKFDAGALVSSILDELNGPLSESSIKLKRTISSVECRSFPMDIEAIVVNFVTNAYHAVKRKTDGRSIEVKVRDAPFGKTSGVEISVHDSGYGFPAKDIDMIWQPLFSTRQKGGTGLGLTIVRSAVEELGGHIKAEANGKLGGASFYAWVPKG